MKAVFAAVAAAIIVVGAFAAVGTRLAPAAFEHLLQAYLADHPEVVADALQRVRDRDAAQAGDRKLALLASRAQELRYDPRLPVLGNPMGDVTVVEFFDYKCPFCRQFHPQLAGFLARNPNVRFVLQDFAILGPESVLAARAALAVWEHDKAHFAAFHDALMRAPGRFDENTILRIAGELGIDRDGLMLDMADPKIDRRISELHALGAAIGVTGTPGFLIGDVLVPGYIDAADMERLVGEARQKCATCGSPAGG
jgi:protein-disulfide isomerase